MEILCVGEDGMELFGVGNVVLYYREKENLSQMQVCEGICNEMAMSRIETGEREFDSLISETLLERLGKTTNRLEFVLNDEDYYYYNLRENIVKTVEAEEFEFAKAYIADYRKDMPTNHVLHEQFLLYYEALIMKAEMQSRKEIVECLYRAINLTRRDFKEPTAQIRLYSGIEIKIIYELFLYEKYSYETLMPVFQFIGKMYDEEVKRMVLIPFLYQFGQSYLQEENWYELEKMVDKAIALLQGGRTYLYLLEIHFMKMIVEYQLYHRSEDWAERSLELLEKCNNIYYMAMTIENPEIMKKVKDFCEEKLGCQITM